MGGFKRVRSEHIILILTSDFNYKRGIEIRVRPCQKNKNILFITVNGDSDLSVDIGDDDLSGNERLRFDLVVNSSDQQALRRSTVVSISHRLLI